MNSPTQRSLKLLRDAGYTVAITEHWNPFCKRRVDLFNFIDLLAISPSLGILAVQTTSGSNVSARMEKIRQTAAAGIWLASGGKIEVHGWRKVGPRGKRKVWECRREKIETELQGCGDCDPCVGGHPEQCAVGAITIWKTNE